MPSYEYAKLILLFLLLAATVFVYARTLHYGFILDDHFLIEEKVERLSNPGNIPRYFFNSYSGNENIDLPNYRPIVNIINSLNLLLLGKEATGFHLLNLIFHLINITLLFYLLIRMKIRLNVAFWVSGIFALHPMVVPSVAWISGRTDIIALSFILATMHFMISYRESKKLGFIIGACLLYFIALFSKEIAYLFPLAAFSYFWLSTDDNPKEAAEVVLPLALSFVLYFILKASFFMLVPFHGTFKFSNLVMVPSVLSHYLKNIFFPQQLVFIPNFENVVRISASGFIGFAIFLIFAVLAFVFPLKKYRWGILWFIFFIAPVLQIFSFNKPAAYYYYIPIIGILVFSIGMMDRFFENIKFHKYIENTLFAVLLIILTIVSIGYAKNFQNQRKLAESTLEQSPDNRYAAEQLGYYEYVDGNFERAIELYHLSMEPGKSSTELLNRMGMTFQKAGEFDSARVYFEKSLAIKKSPITYRLLGKLYMQTGNIAEAIDKLHWAVRTNPNDYKSYADLILLFAEIDDLDNAKKAFDYSTEANPKYWKSYRNMGNVYLNNEKYKKAVELYEKALKLNPADEILYKNIGIIYYRLLDNNKKAVDYLKQYIKLAEKDEELDTIKNIIKNNETKDGDEN